MNDDPSKVVDLDHKRSAWISGEGHLLIQQENDLGCIYIDCDDLPELIRFLNTSAEDWNKTGELTIEDYEKSFKDHQRLVREIDVIINGEDGAAIQASLCDLVGQIRSMKQSNDIWVPKVWAGEGSTL